MQWLHNNIINSKTMAVAAPVPVFIARQHSTARQHLLTRDIDIGILSVLRSTPVARSF